MRKSLALSAACVALGGAAALLWLSRREPAEAETPATAASASADLAKQPPAPDALEPVVPIVEQHTVELQVLDALFGDSIPAAELEAAGEIVKTDARGKVIFRIPPGATEATVRKEGYETLRLDLRETPKSRIFLRGNTTLTATVVAPSGTAPSDLLALLSPAGRPLVPCPSAVFSKEREHRMTLPHIPGGRRLTLAISLQVGSASRSAPRSFLTPIQGGELDVGAFVLETAARITLVFAEGIPEDGKWQVTVHGDRLGLPGWRRSSLEAYQRESGIPNLLPGAYRLSLSRNQGTLWETEVTLSEGEERRILVPAIDPGEARVRVSNQHGNPLEGADVRIARESRPEERGSTDRNGEYRCSFLEAARVTVGYPPVLQDFDVDAGSLELECVLVVPAPAALRVFGLREGDEVRLRSPLRFLFGPPDRGGASLFEAAAVCAGEEVLIENLCPGSYDVEVNPVTRDWSVEVTLAPGETLELSPPDVGHLQIVTGEFWKGGRLEWRRAGADFSTPASGDLLDSPEVFDVSPGRLHVLLRKAPGSVIAHLFTTTVPEGALVACEVPDPVLGAVLWTGVSPATGGPLTLSKVGEGSQEPQQESLGTIQVLEEGGRTELTPGRYMAAASRGEFGAGRHVSFEVHAGAETTVDLGGPAAPEPARIRLTGLGNANRYEVWSRVQGTLIKGILPRGQPLELALQGEHRIFARTDTGVLVGSASVHLEPGQETPVALRSVSATGKLTNANGTPLAYTRVSLCVLDCPAQSLCLATGIQALSDASGNFLLPQVPPERYRVEAAGASWVWDLSGDTAGPTTFRTPR